MRAATLATVLVVIAALGGLSVGLMAAPDAVRPALRSITGWAGGSSEATATVSGRVRLQGRPVPYARVELQHNGGSHVAVTGPDGSFVLEDVPAGTVQVTVHTGDLPAGEAGDIEVGSDSRFVPERYGAVATSGLRLELAPGEQYRAINLQY